MDLKGHWQRVYTEKDTRAVSWYQESPAISLNLIETAGVTPDARILDVGAGHSRLVDELLDRGYRHVGVLDIAPAAVEIVQDRLGPKAHTVEWYVADVTGFASPHAWDLWHDRAVFHFLVDRDVRQKYLDVMDSSVRPGGYAVLATFGPTGPDRCSGLPVQRYSTEELSTVLGSEWELGRTEAEEHRTPSGTTQDFVYGLFRRR